ncbi:MAG: YigZ family protein [Firmicutes bacterium]|nr:YigZ family protein [Bacillota bacterium]
MNEQGALGAANDNKFNDYKTLAGEGIAETIEKKSRFIATVRPVESEEEARAFIDGLKKKYWDATHNVFAYSVGIKNETHRFSDDGEPQGTAGLPVLSAITGAGLKNTAVVVTRYFGGTLLGTGGLVRAYGRSASEGIKAAGIVRRALMQELLISMDYSLYGKAEYIIRNAGLSIMDSQFAENVSIRLLVSPNQAEDFLKELKEATAARISVSKLGEYFVALPCET